MTTPESRPYSYQKLFQDLIGLADTLPGHLRVNPADKTVQLMSPWLDFRLSSLQPDVVWAWISQVNPKVHEMFPERTLYTLREALNRMRQQAMEEQPYQIQVYHTDTHGNPPRKARPVSVSGHPSLKAAMHSVIPADGSPLRLLTLKTVGSGFEARLKDEKYTYLYRCTRKIAGN